MSTEMDKDRKNVRRFDTVEKALQANKTHENNEKILFKECSGFLDILYTQQGSYGFLRSDLNVINEPEDIYVPPNIIKINKLRPGDYVVGIKKCKTISDNKYDSITEIKTVNGEPLDKIKERVVFEKLTTIFPTEQIKLSTNPITYSTRIIDLFTPIGKGQRGLIVAPPKSGKTMLLKDIANGISTNHPEIKLIILLIGERPEEVTDMRKSVSENVEVIASTFDEAALRQTKIATFALEKAKRLVEKGEDVVILMDSITRLARAYNITTPSSGKILSGGIEMTSLDAPKKFFGTARNVEDGGSLTIIATALVDTGSKMDDVIFEEFKGTGNMELQLDRNLAIRRIYPAINVQASSTRREELLLKNNVLLLVHQLRKTLADEPTPVSATEWLLSKMQRSNTNEDFLYGLLGEKI